MATALFLFGIDCLYTYTRGISKQKTTTLPKKKEKKPNSHFDNSKLPVSHSRPPGFFFPPPSNPACCAHLSAGVNNIATNDSAIGHHVEYFLQLRKTDSLEGGVDEAAGKEVEGLLGVLSVADVGALDGDHADDALKDGGRDAGAGGETDADDAAAGADVVGGLLEGLLGDCEQDGGVGAQAVRGGGLDIGDEVLGGKEVDVGGGAQLPGRLALLLAAVDGDGVDAHGLAVLQGHVAQATAGTGDGDPLPGADAGLLDALVDGYTRAQDGGDSLEAYALGDAGHVGGLGDGVLLEGTVDGVARELGLGAEGLVGGHTEGARQAGAVEPLDADLVALVDVLDELTPGDDNACALVATDQGHLDGQGPVALHGVQVCVAHTRELDIDEDLIGTGFGDRDLLVLESCEWRVSLDLFGVAGEELVDWGRCA
jgi:hypothetical protein